MYVQHAPFRFKVFGIAFSISARKSYLKSRKVERTWVRRNPFGDRGVFTNTLDRLEIDDALCLVLGSLQRVGPDMIA